MDDKIIAANIRKLRNQNDMSQEELAKKVGISRSTLSKIESQKSEGRYSMDLLNRIAESLNVRIFSLFFEDEEDDDDSATEFFDKYTSYFYPKIKAPYNYISLLEFIIYLPLIEDQYLADFFRRVGGSIIGYEDYINSQIEFLISTIDKDIPAMKYAEEQCKYIVQIREGHNPTAVRVEKNITFPEFQDDYYDYCEKVEMYAKKEALWRQIKEFYEISRRKA